MKPDKAGYYGETASECAKTTTRVDIKTELKSQIAYIETLINDWEEKLRITKAKLKLIEKNSDLEAYLNLDRMR